MTPGRQDVEDESPLADRVAPAVLVKARRVRLLILDVDGVLTDGRLYYGPDGAEQKAFHAQDGSAIKRLCAAGIPVALISGRRSEAARRRAAELALRHVYLGREDKTAALAELNAQTDIEPARMAHVGDDIADLPLFECVGMALTVADAHPAVRARADYVASLGGGRGAVREICDLLLRAQGKWPHPSP